MGEVEAAKTNERMMEMRSPWITMNSPVMWKGDAKNREIGTRVGRTTRETSQNQRASMMTQMTTRMRMIDMRASTQPIKGTIANLSRSELIRVQEEIGI